MDESSVRATQNLLSRDEAWCFADIFQVMMESKLQSLVDVKSLGIKNAVYEEDIQIGGHLAGLCSVAGCRGRAFSASLPSLT